MMTYEETLAWMHSMPRANTEPTLSRMQRLLAMLGDPQKTMARRFLHVTGTNGKGSVCAFLSCALRRAGYRVGRFISPFIMDFCERMEINGEMISRAEVALIGDRLRSVVERFTQETGEAPLEFELVTLMGLVWFAQMRCDLVVLEVGIGGTFDATNVIEPLISVIMRIDYDHTELLGNTRAEIAKRKSGIIKAGAPCVLYGDCDEDVRQVIAERCAVQGSTLILTEPEKMEIKEAALGKLCFAYRGKEYMLRLCGVYQARNALAAIDVLHHLGSLGVPVSEDSIRDGLAETSFPARFEILGTAPTVILDGAHNASGIEALAENISFYFQDQPILCLCGMLRDKNPEQTLSALFAGTEIRHAVCITPPSPRAMEGEALAALFEKKGISAEYRPSAAEALDTLLVMAEQTHLPMICFGSLYIAGDIRRWCGRYTENDTVSEVGHT
ncbi:MAG: bifunctional folylpolyglutamate synthase/dihydrofolate synthase [Clostridia bacterium]|nr:bifunctional folylpolyglutamate synthase/dihydrofolate synthase [Clostridia bacterium]